MHVAGLELGTAIATSLAIVAPMSMVAPAIDWPLAAGVGGHASIGSVAGARLGHRVNASALRRAFAILMVLTAFVQLMRAKSSASGDAIEQPI